jgi:hypothetical protein
MGSYFISTFPDNEQLINNDNHLNYINEIYRNNGYDPLESREQIINENTKHTKSYKFPIMIKHDNIFLERDAIERNLFYISFKYTSLYDFDVNIYFNAEENFNSKEEQYFIPTENFKNYILKSNNVKSGKNETFLDKNCKMDLNYFIDNKIFDKNLYDMIIECIIKINNKKKCSLIVCSKIIKIPDKDEFKIKTDSEKIQIKNKWYEIHDVYGLKDSKDTDIECEACYSNIKNTIFLPCMHSYACDKCAVNVRLRGNKCPLCRQKIRETLLIDNNKEINK